MKRNGDMVFAILMILMFLALLVAMSNAMSAQSQASETDERYVMAHLLSGECQDGSWDMQVAVGSVVLNRVKSKNYPNTIYGVVFDHHNGLQYACTKDGNYYRTPTKRNWKVADYLLEHGSQLPDKVVYQGQRKFGPVYTKIGREIFCYEK